MSFDDEEGLPDLPGSGTPFGSFKRPRHEDDLDEKHALPAFPDSPTHNGFSQAAIKDAVGGQEGELPELPEHSEEEHNDKNSNIVEMEEWQPSTPTESQFPVSGRGQRMRDNFDSDRGAMQRQRFDIPPGGRKGGDVFVKLTKFHSAKRALAEIRDKIEEVDELITRIRDTKMREEQEFAAWENEIMYIKARMKDVAENIFEKVD